MLWLLMFVHRNARTGLPARIGFYIRIRTRVSGRCREPLRTTCAPSSETIRFRESVTTCTFLPSGGMNDRRASRVPPHAFALRRIDAAPIEASTVPDRLRRLPYQFLRQARQLNLQVPHLMRPLRGAPSNALPEP